MTMSAEGAISVLSAGEYRLSPDAQASALAGGRMLAEAATGLLSMPVALKGKDRSGRP